MLTDKDKIRGITNQDRITFCIERVSRVVIWFPVCRLPRLYAGNRQKDRMGKAGLERKGRVRTNKEEWMWPGNFYSFKSIYIYNIGNKAIHATRWKKDQSPELRWFNSRNILTSVVNVVVFVVAVVVVVVVTVVIVEKEVKRCKAFPQKATDWWKPSGNRDEKNKTLNMPSVARSRRWYLIVAAKRGTW